MRHCRRKDRELENSDENYPKRNNNNKIKAKKKWTVHQMSQRTMSVGPVFAQTA